MFLTPTRMLNLLYFLPLTHTVSQRHDTSKSHVAILWASLCSLPSIDTADMIPAAKESDTGTGDICPPPIQKSLVSMPLLLYQ